MYELARQSKLYTQGSPPATMFLSSNGEFGNIPQSADQGLIVPQLPQDTLSSSARYGSARIDRSGVPRKPHALETHTTIRDLAYPLVRQI